MQMVDYDTDDNVATQMMGNDADDNNVAADINAATQTMR
jgi:hypothetical protein